MQGGVSNNPELGKAQGMIGLLSDMRISRKAYTVQAILAAMIASENEALYA